MGVIIFPVVQAREQAQNCDGQTWKRSPEVGGPQLVLSPTSQVPPAILHHSPCHLAGSHLAVENGVAPPTLPVVGSERREVLLEHFPQTPTNDTHLPRHPGLKARSGLSRAHCPPLHTNAGAPSGRRETGVDSRRQSCVGGSRSDTTVADLTKPGNFIIRIRGWVVEVECTQISGKGRTGNWKSASIPGSFYSLSLITGLCPDFLCPSPQPM